MKKKMANETRKITKKYKLCYELSNVYLCSISFVVSEKRTV
jgi:hypothetical protein